MNALNLPIKGRGAAMNTANRFHALHYEQSHLEAIDDWEPGRTRTQYFEEDNKTILNKITSPDIPLAFSLNPYQGCEHGCVYCYARNSHEYWGFSAGLDFEQKIMLKPRAADRLREIFSRKSWKVQPISLSGNTDCYQPIERSAKITRQVLEVCLEFQNPVGIITKNSLILRDLDILQALAAKKLVSVFTSITSVDETLRRKLEPRTSRYDERFKLIETLSKQGIHTGVMNAPIIPGINDTHMSEVLRRASHAGAKQAGYTMVRLNGAIGPIFKNWLELHFPDRAGKVWNMISEAHGGKVNDSRFGTRMKGEGPMADIVHQQFLRWSKQYHLNETKFEYNLSEFIRHKPGQLRLF